MLIKEERLHVLTKRGVLAVSESDVMAFLSEVKQLARLRGRFFLIPRAVNNDTIRKLGLSEGTVRSVVGGLEVGDYSAGPEEDRDGSKVGRVWVFGKKVKGYEIYIKLKIFSAEVDGVEVRYLKCISFHVAEHGLRYPFRIKR